MEEIFRRLSAITGEISLAISRGSATKGMFLSWVQRLRSLADELEKKAR